MKGALTVALYLLPAAAAGAGPEEEMLVQLLGIRRVYVDRLAGGETAVQIRDMVINSLQRAGLFVITENPERADAILRGSAEDMIFTDTFQSSDSVDARAAVGAGSTTPSVSRGGMGRRNTYLSAAVGENESSRIAERKHEALAALRLVNKDGDVIWSTTQESLGGKFRGASADVAEKITRQLAGDFERAKKIRAASAGSP